ncbi:RICIN domain-containing protein [Actinokineospora terrae]|uniref:Ricin-type beta-trefoil lectin domain-containing protein n=1 Tax=Actinokineospora terrae TaxID=155974 RepID=A0A1H9S225_9PSEU|nr:RICIN domain-containing protein [Actinokineospora terrae]SER78675.1 Ricin-type beta-trefoil lectin domain-containing protein [Actinokineospora terrae]
MTARTLVAAITGAVAIVLASALPASADVDGAWHELRSNNSDKCLDVAGASLDGGANVIQWTCHGGDNQKWQLVLVESYDIYQVVSAGSGKCLDVTGASTDNGAQVIQWDCSGDTNQQWQLIPRTDNGYELQAVHSSKCLDVTGASTEDGAKVIQWECSGNDNQAWSITNV